MPAFTPPLCYVRNYLTREIVAGPFSDFRAAFAFAAERNRACGARVYGLARNPQSPAGFPRVIAIED